MSAARSVAVVTVLLSVAATVVAVTESDPDNPHRTGTVRSVLPFTQAEKDLWNSARPGSTPLPEGTRRRHRRQRLVR